MSGLKRIILHWTAGSHTPNATDKKAYHFLIAGDGTIHAGTFKPEANISPVKGAYAAHTLNLNTGSIGVALCAMAGAVERPFSAGRYPITEAQQSALTGLLVDLCDKYGIAVTQTTVLTHAEVEGTLGIKQRQKWDITWLPDMAGPRPAREVGDILRERVRRARATTPEIVNPTSNIFQTIATLLARIFGGKK